MPARFHLLLERLEAAGVESGVDACRRGDERAKPGPAGDQPFEFQPGHRLANRGPGGGELLRELVLGRQPVPRDELLRRNS